MSLIDEINSWIKETDEMFSGEQNRVPLEYDLLTRARDELARRDELVSAIKSINHSKHHIIKVAGDDDPCYWQRKEWVDWVLDLANKSATPDEG